MRIPAILIVFVSTMATLTGLVLIARTPEDAIPVGFRLDEMVPVVLLELTYTGVGALIVWRRPENPIGWLLSGTALASAILVLLSGQFVHASATGATRVAATAAWLSGLIVVVGLGATQGPAMASFPDGRLPSRMGRVALLLLAITVVLWGAAVAFRPGPLSMFPGVMNPLAWQDHGGALDTAFAFGVVLGLVAGVLGISSQVQRFRGASGVERQQLKWFLAGALFLSLALIPAIALLYGPSDPSAASTQRYAGRALGALASAALPVAIGIAILRHRLYDIDVLIRRTLVYAALSAILVTVYVAAVVVVGAVLRPLTAGSDLAVAVSTLVVVALFQPIRRRVQDLIDRRFYRSRYDAVRTLDAFSARRRNEVELDAVRADLLGAVGETVRPTHASLWLRWIP